MIALLITASYWQNCYIHNSHQGDVYNWLRLRTSGDRFKKGDRVLNLTIINSTKSLEIGTMQYQVFVRSQSKSQFVASVVGMPNLTVEGRTEEEAIANAKAALKAQLAMGKFVTIEMNPEDWLNENISQIEKPFFETATNEEWEAALMDLANSSFFNKTMPLSDEAISRESIYSEREDSQL